MMIEILNTSFFDPIVSLITLVKPPEKFVEITIPPGLSLDQNEILKYFNYDDATMHYARDEKNAERLNTKLSGTIKDQRVFDYLYSKYNELNEMG